MKKRIIRVLAAAVMILMASSAAALAVDQYYPDVTEPSPGCVFTGIAGTYESVSKDEIVNRINEIRYEAYQEGIISRYQPVRWSRGLERIAQIRAVEASVLEDHERPNGKDTSDMEIDGATGGGENLAWGAYSGLFAVELWYLEKANYVSRTGEWGHYRALVSPNYSYIGLGSFTRGDLNCISIIFNTEGGVTVDLDEQTGITGKCIQLIEVPADKASDYARYAAFEDEETPSLPKVKIKKPAASKKAVTVRWKKPSKKKLKLIKKVQIQICQDPSFSEGVMIRNVSAKKTSCKFKRLRSKSTYYMRIRAYTKSGGKTFVSDWSAIKAAKAK